MKTLIAASLLLLAIVATPRSAAVPFSPTDQRSSGVPPAAAYEPAQPLPVLGPNWGQEAGRLDQSGSGTPYNLDPRVGREGDIAHSGSRSPYVAIPLGPGIRIRVCGPAACISVTSTDAGPNRAMLLAGRIMDLDITRWERVCGVPARYGLCPGSWVRESGPRMTLPPTDSTSTEGGQP